MSKTIVIRLAAGLFLIIIVGVGAGIYLTRSKAGQSAKTTTTGVTDQTATPPPSTAPQGTVYKNGTYSSDGTYRSPGGDESIGVTMIIETDKVTKVIVIPKTTHQASLEFQDFFSEGISDIVNGRPLSEDFNVSRLNGSSLTGKGFMQAVEAIRSQAKA